MRLFGRKTLNAMAGTFAVLVISIPVAIAHTVTPKPVQITVYKDPDCGCCKNWVDHLRAHGFVVTTRDTRDMASVKGTFGVSRELHSCHTALVSGYVIEGHVPARDIQRLLKERPKVAGLAVPGMPMGSPGMEGPVAEPYSVIAFDKAGKKQIFAKH